MTDYHPLTQKIIEVANVDDFVDHPDFEGGQIDRIIREHLAPTETVESGVRFPDHPDMPVEVQATFIEPGNQMSMAIIGTEPVLLVQPEFNAEANLVTFLVTAVALDPAGLVQTLEVMLDAARTMATQQGEALYRLNEEGSK